MDQGEFMPAPGGAEAVRAPGVRLSGPTGEGAFSILIVCTGNVCRSPIAEGMLRARLATAGVVAEVASAGTRALVGHPMTPEAAGQLAAYGGTPWSHQARQLTAEMVENADLILTATRDHRGEVVSTIPAASRNTFTLQQFARISASEGGLVRGNLGPDDDDAPPMGSSSLRQGLQSYVAAIAASRGYVPPPARSVDDDIEDPYRQSKQVYRRSARAIDEAVATIVAGLTQAAARS